VNVPHVEEDNMAFFRFSGLSTFTQDVSGIEDVRSLLPSRGIQSDVQEIVELAKDLTEGLTDEREIAEAVYAYTAQNIAYDVEKYEQNLFELDDSALKTLDEQKGVCQDYAFLAVALFRAIGVEANFISGTAQGGLVPERHAWVEVKVDGDWLVMDPTWGAGYIQDGEFVFDYNEDYFDPDEAFFEETHTREEVMY
jgi:transglutaminase-like putative cysteine protease